MWIKTLIIISFVFSVGCSAVSSRVPSTASSSDLEPCKIAPDIELKGQLLVHYHGMILKLDGCPPNIPVEQDIKFNDPEEVGKIWAVLPYPRNEDLYVDIVFFASETTDGDILIEHVVSAQLTKESEYVEYFKMLDRLLEQ